MPLSYIFHALSRDAPLGHVYRAQPNSQIAKLAKYLDIWLFGYLVRYFEHSQVGYPWKDQEKSSSEALTWGPYDPLVKSYGQNIFFNLFFLVFYIVSQKNKQHVFRTSFRPNPNVKMSQMAQKSKIQGLYPWGATCSKTTHASGQYSQPPLDSRGRHTMKFEVLN